MVSNTFMYKVVSYRVLITTFCTIYKLIVSGAGLKRTLA